MTDKTITNDLTIMVATVNGSGSQSSNLILSRSLFAMGIPMSAKNLFPSNIQGLPTWFTVRANGQGYTAQKDEVDVMVCFNLVTFEEDVNRVHSGGVVIYDDSYPASVLEGKDVISHGVPFKKLAKQHIEHDKLRKLLTNLIYVGVVAHLIGIDPDVVEQQIAGFFKAKPKAVPLNVKAFNVGLEWAKENIEKRDPYRVEAIPGGNKDQILIDGNAAAGMGSVFGGCTVLTWYPITPSSSLCESAISYLHKLRIDPESGARNFAVVQAEDELAAAGMVIGAGWAGARSMTATSGPGISLMGEFIGLAYYAEIPAVIWDIQRGGPSTGLPTRTQQCDIQACARASHGDTRHVCLIPHNPKECFEFAELALDLAERLQTVIFVLSDLDLGMNTWASERFDYNDKPYDRGKVLNAEELDKVEDWGRYKDVDGDAIGYRTLPGTEHVRAAYFTRGTGHDEYARYSENNDVYRENLERLTRKYETCKQHVPAPVLHQGDYGEATVGLIAYGSTDQAMREARDYLAQQGVPTDYLRIRAIPFQDSVRDFVESHERVFLIEQNRDAQMKAVYCEDNPDHATQIESVLHFDGMSIDAKFIVDTVTEALKREEMGVHGS